MNGPDPIKEGPFYSFYLLIRLACLFQFLSFTFTLLTVVETTVKLEAQTHCSQVLTVRQDTNNIGAHYRRRQFVTNCSANVLVRSQQLLVFHQMVIHQVVVLVWCDSSELVVFRGLWFLFEFEPKI